MQGPATSGSAKERSGERCELRQMARRGFLGPLVRLPGTRERRDVHDPHPCSSASLGSPAGRGVGSREAPHTYQRRGHVETLISPRTRAEGKRCSREPDLAAEDRYLVAQKCSIVAATGEARARRPRGTFRTCIRPTRAHGRGGGGPTPDLRVGHDCVDRGGDVLDRGEGALYTAAPSGSTAAGHDERPCDVAGA